MKVNKIETLRDLQSFIPELIRLHESLEGRWEPDMTTDEFLSRLIEYFRPGKTHYFGLLSDSGELLYFVAFLPEEKPKGTFWLFYMNKDYRNETDQLLGDLAKWAIEEGYTIIYSQSTRSEKSYERWLSKFGATKVATVYKFNLV